MLNDKIKKSYYDRNQWVDPYDSETLSNKYVRAFIRRTSLLLPKTLYRLNIIEKHFWPENLVLLGIAALNLRNKNLVNEIVEEIIAFNDRQLFWGLPIDWHSGEYKFPRNTLMSTTTAETILFLAEVEEVYGNINKEILITSTYQLYQSLNKNYIDKTNYMFSYTPMDKYKVYNSNLLVAAAMAVVGDKYNDQKLLGVSQNILNVCIDNLPLKGFVPYHFGGSESTSDSYHQLFSIRALWYLKKIFPDANILYERTLKYFWNYFYQQDSQTIKLKLDKRVLDLQPYAEALRVAGLTEDWEKYNTLMESIKPFRKKNEYIQRVWPLGRIRIHSNVCYSRQGLFRLYTGLSYQRSVTQND